MLSSESNYGWNLINLGKLWEIEPPSQPQHKTMEVWSEKGCLPQGWDQLQAHMKFEIQIECSRMMKNWGKFVKWEMEMRPASLPLPWNLDADLNSKLCCFYSLKLKAVNCSSYNAQLFFSLRFNWIFPVCLYWSFPQNPGHYLELSIDLIYDLIEGVRSEEHTSELQSHVRISYAVFCLKKKTVLYI